MDEVITLSDLTRITKELRSRLSRKDRRQQIARNIERLQAALSDAEAEVRYLRGRIIKNRMELRLMDNASCINNP